jgi:DeoR family glycerol-3-phosphate regulon repressor
VWLAADSTKFNRPAMVELAHLSHIDHLFTDAPPPESFVHLLEQSGVECTVADESKSLPALSLVS